MPMLRAAETLSALRESSLLIHHITNWVTINDCAQVTRHWGCLPVMAHAKEEVAEMTGLAGALVLNIGTLTPELIEAMLMAATAAGEKGIPVVLDIVGAGATELRTEQARRIINQGRVSVIKGNAGEVGTLAGIEAEVRGVESVSVAGDVKEAAKSLASDTGCTVAVTGPTDIVTDGNKTYLVEYGHPMMGQVVGTGCIAASTIGCFTAAGGDLVERAALGLGCLGVAGERAAEKMVGPGDYLPALRNEIFRLSEDPGELLIEAKEA